MNIYFYGFDSVLAVVLKILECRIRGSLKDFKNTQVKERNKERRIC